MLETAIQNNNFAELEQFFETGEGKDLPYEERNELFITSSKLKAFDYCPWAYKLRFIDKVPNPANDEDYFTIGQAVDDFLTEGSLDDYTVVSRRVDPNEGIIEQMERIKKAETDTLKDGSLSARAKKTIEAANQKIEELRKMEGLTQLTESQYDQVQKCVDEFNESPLTCKSPKKKVLFWHIGRGKVVKVELDNYIEGKEIRDIKTTANITKFNPASYLLQMCLYQLVVEEVTGERLPVILEVVDKWKYASRSRVVQFSDQTLVSYRNTLMRIIHEYIEAHELEWFEPTTDQEKKYNSPYYGYQGYGRPTEIEIY